MVSLSSAEFLQPVLYSVSTLINSCFLEALSEKYSFHFKIAYVNDCRDEDANMFQQGNQEVKNHIQSLEHANKKWQEYYSEKAFMKQELIRVLTAYETGC